MSEILEKARSFAALHQSGQVFAIPNPWDVASALILQEAGFVALATTSSGFAQSLGKADGEATLEETLEHCRGLVARTRVPISADFEHGFADAPEAAADNLRRLAETGVAGGSIEDYSRTRVYDFEHAVERIAACAEAVAALPTPFTLTARAEGLLRETAELDEVIRRLQAFEQAGADVLYAPALKTVEQIQEVVSAVSRPINVLAVFLPDLSLADYSRLGVARVSVGGALARTVHKATLAAVEEMSASWRS